MSVRYGVIFLFPNNVIFPKAESKKSVFFPFPISLTLLKLPSALRPILLFLQKFLSLSGLFRVSPVSLEISPKINALSSFNSKTGLF